jgi:hypothetical protein
LRVKAYYLSVDIPKTAVAGDSWAFDWSKAGYQPIDNWDKMEMVLSLATERLTGPGTAGTGLWTFTFLPVDTAKCKAALYRWNILAWRGTNRYTADIGDLAVSTDPQGVDIVQPTGPVALTLAEAKQTRFRLLSSESVQATFQGHTYTLRNLDELQRIIDALERELADEETELSGAKKTRIIYHRFVKNPPA